MNSNHSSENIWKIALIVICVAFGAAAIYWIVPQKNKANSEINRTTIVDEFKPSETPPQETSSNPANPSTPPQTANTDAPRGPGSVLGTSTGIPAPVATKTPVATAPATTTPQPISKTAPAITPGPAPTPTTKEYRGDSFAFRASAPYNAVFSTTADTVTAGHPGGGAYWIINIYTTKETLHDVEQQLANSPSVTRLSHTTYVGEPALEYYANNSNSKTIAVIHNGRLYYIMGYPINFEFI